MSDELDVMLRRVMKSLDDQVPSGYFDDLPRQTLARLEASMQTTGNENERDRSTGAQPVTNEREEDSGLHDIRSLASSTKLRIARRTTMSHAVPDDDVLASSSAGWKAAVALPEPAKMVSLPDLAALPSRTEIEAIDREARAKAKAEAKAEAEAKTKAESKTSEDAKAGAVAAASTATAIDSAASTPSPATATSSGGRGKVFAIAGIGIAAAAGAAIFFATRGGGDESKSSLSYESKPQEPIAERTAQQLPPPPAPDPTPDPAPVAVAAADPAPTPDPEPPVEEPKVVAKAETKDKDKDKDKAKVHKVEIRDTPKAETKQVAAAAPTPKKDEPKKSDDGEPSFDELLKEAGVTEKKETKPKLEKKALSSADIKTGMSAVAGKAQACYQGTQGVAQVKLTVDPSGTVSKVTVTGAFAGTPVASCVEAAVKSATFPPWDGGPQTFGYSYLLAE